MLLVVVVVVVVWLVLELMVFLLGFASCWACWIMACVTHEGGSILGGPDPKGCLGVKDWEGCRRN